MLVVQANIRTHDVEVIAMQRVRLVDGQYNTLQVD
jgi:hypothetical protein